MINNITWYISLNKGCSIIGFFYDQHVFLVIFGEAPFKHVSKFSHYIRLLSLIPYCLFLTLAQLSLHLLHRETILKALLWTLKFDSGMKQKAKFTFTCSQNYCYTSFFKRNSSNAYSLLEMKLWLNEVKSRLKSLLNLTETLCIYGINIRRAFFFRCNIFCINEFAMVLKKQCVISCYTYKYNFFS